MEHNGATDNDQTGVVRRYRCNACGNLTRFDVISTVRSRAFHHYSVGGELTVEDAEVLDEQIEDVSCRWCSSGASVVEIDPSADPGDEAGAEGADVPPQGAATG